MYGSDKFNFTIKQGEEFGSPDEGPQTDDEGNTKGHFTYIKSGVSGTEEGLEDRLMAPPAPWPVELTPSSVVSLLVVTEIVVVSLS